jgi:hypothetical protein
MSNVNSTNLLYQVLNPQNPAFAWLIGLVRTNPNNEAFLSELWRVILIAYFPFQSTYTVFPDIQKDRNGIDYPLLNVILRKDNNEGKAKDRLLLTVHFFDRTLMEHANSEYAVPIQEYCTKAWAKGYMESTIYCARAWGTNVEFWNCVQPEGWTPGTSLKWKYLLPRATLIVANETLDETTYDLADDITHRAIVDAVLMQVLENRWAI